MVLGRDAGSGIAHLQAHRLTLPRGFDVDTPAARGELDGVVHQVGEQAAQQIDIGAHGQLRRAVGAQADAARLRDDAEAGLQCVQQAVQLQAARLRQHDAGIELGDVEQRIEHRAQLFQAGVDHVHDRAHLGRQRAVPQRTHVQRHRLQRLAQVVAGAGQEAALVVVCAHGLVARAARVVRARTRASAPALRVRHGCRTTPRTAPGCGAQSATARRRTSAPARRHRRRASCR